MDWGLEVGRCKLLYIGYIHSPMISQNEKEYIYMHITESLCRRESTALYSRMEAHIVNQLHFNKINLKNMFFFLFDNYTFIMGFPHSSVGKESACNAGDPSLIPRSGRFPGEGKGYPFQYSGLENSMDSIVHGVAKSRTRLSDFHSLYSTFIITGKSRLKFRVVVILTQLYPINTYPLNTHNVNYIVCKNQVRDS